MADNKFIKHLDHHRKRFHSDLREGKKDVILTEKKGTAFATCSAKGDNYICCNVKVLKAVSNCPYECSYCFLQDYLTDTQMQVVKDTHSLIQEVIDYLKDKPKAFIRVGTWELGDSLALEAQTGQAYSLIEAFADIPQAVLELKTKSDQVSSILTAKHKGRTVVSWSMNSEEICLKEEYKTASLNQRIDAARRCQDAGYLIGLHFEPLMLYDGWQVGYRSMLEMIFSKIDVSRVAWISMGSLRFNPQMRLSMQRLYPKSKALENEMLRGPDGKMRYVKSERKSLYRYFYNALCDVLKQDNLGPLNARDFNKPMLYLCMERWDMFRAVFGQVPDSTSHLEALFTDSLKSRFSYLFK